MWTVYFDCDWKFILVHIVWAIEEPSTYKVSGSAGRMNHKVCHVSDEVSCQSQVEQHVENIKQHLPWVLSMQVSIASGCECCDRPVHCSDISVPKTIFFEIWVHCADPCLFWIRVSVCYQIVKASGTMHCKKGHLKFDHNLHGEIHRWCLEENVGTWYVYFEGLTEMSFVHRVQK